MENYEAVWKVLEELAIALKTKGAGISGDTMKKLRSTRAMISIYRADPTYEDSIELIESYLGDLEAELVSMAEGELGSSFAEQWMRRIAEARQREPKEEAVERGFPSGVPRGDYWIRVRLSDTITSEELRQTAAQEALSMKEEVSGSVIVHGEETKVKKMVREIAGKMRERKDRI